MSKPNKKGFSPLLPIILLAGSGTVVLIFSSLFSPLQPNDTQTPVREDDVDIIGGIDFTTETEENIIKLIEGIGDFEGNSSGFEDGVPGLDESVTGFDGSVTGLDGSVTGLDGNVTGLDGSVTGLDGSVPGLNEGALGFDESVGDFNIKTGSFFEFDNPFSSRSSDVFNSRVLTSTSAERQFIEAPDIPLSKVNIAPISTTIEGDLSLTPFVNEGGRIFEESARSKTGVEGNIGKLFAESLLISIGATFAICFASSKLAELFPSITSVTTSDRLGGIKECGLDTIATGLAKSILYKLVQDYISWASGGFQEGSPRFLAEPQEFVDSFVDDEIGRALDVHGFGFFCSGDLRVDVPINFRYRSLDIESPECTLEDYKRNIKAFEEDPLKVSVNFGEERLKVSKERLFGERISKTEEQSKKLKSELEKLNNFTYELNPLEWLKTRDERVNTRIDEAKQRTEPSPLVQGDAVSAYEIKCNEKNECKVEVTDPAENLRDEQKLQTEAFYTKLNNADEFGEIIGIAAEATIIGVVKSLAASLKKDGGVSASREIAKRSSAESSPFNSIAAEIWVNVFSKDPTFISFVRRNIELNDVSYTLGYLSNKIQGISQTANIRLGIGNSLTRKVANNRGLLLTEINLLPGKNKDDSLRSYVSDLIPYKNKSGILDFINKLSINEKPVFYSLERISNGLDEKNQYIEVPEDIDNLISLINKSKSGYKKHVDDINIIFNTFIATTEYYNSKKFENYPQILNEFKNGNAKVYVKKKNSGSIKTALSNLIEFQTLESSISQINSDFKCSDVKYDALNKLPDYIDTGCSIFDLYYITEKILDSYDLTTNGSVITIDNSILVKLIYELDLVFKNTNYPAIIPQINTPEEQAQAFSPSSEINIFRRIFDKKPIDSTGRPYETVFINKNNERNPADLDFLTYTPDEAAETYKLNLQAKAIAWRDNYVINFESQ